MTMDQLNESGQALKIAEESMAKAKQENNVTEARNIGILVGQVYTLKVQKLRKIISNLQKRFWSNRHFHSSKCDIDICQNCFYDYKPTK